MAARRSPDRDRLLRNSTDWFSLGAARKRTARQMGRCAECLRPLARARAIYCGSSCRWKFHGRFFWDSARIVVMRRDRYTCQKCRRRGRRAELEVDHIVEIARGGAPLEYANLQTLCRRCHRDKTRAFLRVRGRRGNPLGPPISGETSPGAEDSAEWFPA